MCTYAQFSNLEPLRGRGASIEARKRLRSISYYTLQRYCQFLNMDSHSQQTLAYLLLSAGIQWNTHIHSRLWRICCCRLAYSGVILTFTTDFGVFVVVGWHTVEYSHSQQTLAYLLLSAGIQWNPRLQSSSTSHLPPHLLPWGHVGSTIKKYILL